jgi:hypothetical protein
MLELWPGLPAQDGLEGQKEVVGQRYCLLSAFAMCDITTSESNCWDDLEYPFLKYRLS